MRRKKRHDVNNIYIPDNTPENSSKSESLPSLHSSNQLSSNKPKRKRKNQCLGKVENDRKTKIPPCQFPSRISRCNRFCPKRTSSASGCEEPGDLVEESTREPEKVRRGENSKKNEESLRIAIIEGTIMCERGKLSIEDIVGLSYAKEVIRETVIWPVIRPELFTGLRQPTNGILLFGPAGTGKTLIGKTIASETNSTFFNVSPSTLTSKWMGESEKLVKTLFIVARDRQPSVIFLDEVDALLSHRTTSEGASVRRMKNEFLIQMDGTATCDEDKILVIGATNRPQELDDAARRRFHKRIYIPLPNECGRKEMIGNLLSKDCHTLTLDDIDDIARRSHGFSGADLKNLSHEAAMGPIRDISPRKFNCISKDKMRPITLCDFLRALKRIKPSICRREVYEYEKWDKTFGCGCGTS